MSPIQLNWSWHFRVKYIIFFNRQLKLFPGSPCEALTKLKVMCNARGDFFNYQLKNIECTQSKDNYVENLGTNVYMAPTNSMQFNKYQNIFGIFTTVKTNIFYNQLIFAFLGTCLSVSHYNEPCAIQFLMFFRYCKNVDLFSGVQWNKYQQSIIKIQQEQNGLKYQRFGHLQHSAFLYPLCSLIRRPRSITKI